MNELDLLAQQAAQNYNPVDNHDLYTFDGGDELVTEQEAMNTPLNFDWSSITTGDTAAPANQQAASSDATTSLVTCAVIGAVAWFFLK